jgi:NADPH:quinone reductase-like Zn-dependent oxidoreductase
VKAIVHDRYGSSEVLRLEEVDRPEIGDGDVLVRVRAAGVDMGVSHLVRGLPYLVRLVVGLRRPRRRVPGLDVAGVVEAAGARVTALRPGDEVLGTCEGSFAEYAAAPAERFVRKPASLGFEEAAALPVSAAAALRGLRDVGKLQAGQQVLIVGAGGGVGSYAVQIARAMGAHVTAVCSTSKLELVRSLGAERAIDYTREHFADRSERYDLILEMAGSGPVSKARRALTPTGTIVLGGDEGGGRWLGGLRRQLGALLVAPFVRQRIRALLSLVRADDLRDLCDLVEAGKLAPAVDRSFPLADAAQALDYVESRKARGKVVLRIPS